MTQFTIPFQGRKITCRLPVKADILCMHGAPKLDNPRKRILESINNPIGSPSLKSIIKKKKERIQSPKALVVISDNTRPVPYRGESGILLPIIEQLIAEDIPVDDIQILVATGTHRSLTQSEIRSMIDPRILDMGIEIVNHDCNETEYLSYLGKTQRGTEVRVNSRYINADIKILTGLVESHFMAGASGGRKAICPGLAAEDGTFIFHGAEMLDHPNATDLILTGNPCHDEALEVAKMAGSDFIVNVTLDNTMKISGVFSGNIEAAHEQAVNSLRRFVGVTFKKEYDVVISHGGFVGINHYQVAKTGTAIMKVVRKGGMAIVAADTNDAAHPVGALSYRTVIQLLSILGPQKFMTLIKSEQWTFIPEQWQVQMWCKLFSKIPMRNFYFYSPHFKQEHYEAIPGVSLNNMNIDTNNNDVNTFYNYALKDAAKCLAKDAKDLSIAILLDGPYGIPVSENENKSV